MKVFILLPLLLAACANIYKEPSQEIQISLAGGTDSSARCYLETKDTRHMVQAPSTVWIERSRKPLHVYCRSANGKEAFQTHPSRLNQTAAKNVANAYVGLPYDMVTSLAYSYPNEIVIDFDGPAAVILDTPAPSSYAELAGKQRAESRADIVERARKMLMN